MSLRDTYSEFNEERGKISDSSAKSSLKSSSAKLSLKFSGGTIFLFVALFVSCAVMFYKVAPAHKEAKVIKFTNEVKMRDIEVGRSLLLKIVKINDENRGINNKEVEKIKELIPNRDNYEDYLTHIINLAGNKNVEINGFSISKDEKSEDKDKNKDRDEKKKDEVFNKMSISISASGFFVNFLSFARDIEGGVPFVREKSILISKSESEDNNKSLDYEMNIEFYYY